MFQREEDILKELIDEKKELVKIFSEEAIATETDPVRRKTLRSIRDSQVDQLSSLVITLMDWYFGEVFEADIEITFADNEPPGEKTPRTETPRTGESTRISSMLEIITEPILSSGLNLTNFTSHCSGANQEFEFRSLFLFVAKGEREATEKINEITKEIARKLPLAGITMTRSRLKIKQAYRRELERGLNVHNFEKI